MGIQPSRSQVEPLIDLEHDDLRPVADIAEKRTGKRPPPGCIWRWRRKGCRGVHLECYLYAGVWHTTEKAFSAFILGQTAAAVDACRAAGRTTDRSPTTLQRLKDAGLLSNEPTVEHMRE